MKKQDDWGKSEWHRFDTVWIIITPAGESEPYYRKEDAEQAAAPFGWRVQMRKVEVKP